MLWTTVTKTDKTAGQFADEFIANPHRLAIAHWLLGSVAAFAYWARPGTFTPHLPTFVFRDLTPILLTFVAWLPYVISAMVSRRVLGVRDKKAAIFFTVLATAVTATSVMFYLNIIAFKRSVPPVVVSAAVTFALVFACGLCAFIWPNDASEA
jgi:FtsH-binding integral membrane protein